MIIDPTKEFAMIELEKMKWYLSHIDLTKNVAVGNHIQDAYNSLCEAIRLLKRTAE